MYSPLINSKNRIESKIYIIPAADPKLNSIVKLIEVASFYPSAVPIKLYKIIQNAERINCFSIRALMNKLRDLHTLIIYYTYIHLKPFEF